MLSPFLSPRITRPPPRLNSVRPPSRVRSRRVKHAQSREGDFEIRSERDSIALVLEGAIDRVYEQRTCDWSTCFNGGPLHDGIACRALSALREHSSETRYHRPIDPSPHFRCNRGATWTRKTMNSLVQLTMTPTVASNADGGSSMWRRGHPLGPEAPAGRSRRCQGARRSMQRVDVALAVRETQPADIVRTSPCGHRNDRRARC